MSFHIYVATKEPVGAQKICLKMQYHPNAKSIGHLSVMAWPLFRITPSHSDIFVPILAPKWRFSAYAIPSVGPLKTDIHDIATAKDLPFCLIAITVLAFSVDHDLFLVYNRTPLVSS